jgi:hypothetical protein
MAETRFRPLGGVLDRKLSHPSIPRPRFVIDRFWIFSAVFYLSKVIRLFQFSYKMPFEIFGESIRVV